MLAKIRRFRDLWLRYPSATTFTGLGLATLTVWTNNLFVLVVFTTYWLVYMLMLVIP